ncbi:DNA topoisomerase IV [uncultured Lacinutrix sp.]|uniref:DNA topoisomerase IV n=1 Tax=uncultured Lacinutrix sp. TaxID=574032 RepID=UPI0026313EBA|nr:DNA topoisomerase IV [uncultured Lacinutrix sp.]
MKNIYFLIVLLVTFTSCLNTSKRDCKDYKIGTFTFEYIVNGESKTGYITRSKNLQIETYDNKIDSSEVRWVNDCEVIFKTINPKRMVDKNDIHLKILTTTDSSYTFEYSYVGKTQKQKGIAFKTKLKKK